MRNLLCLAALALMTTAAAPARYSSLSGGAVFQEATIAPDIAPRGRATTRSLDGNYTPAPVPDLQRVPPITRTLGPAQPEFSPGLFQPKTAYRGDGYTQGSTVQGNLERRLRLTPGFNLKMPLD